MSFFNKFKRKDDLADESDYEKYERKHQALRNRVEQIKLKEELRERKREAHPYQEDIRQRIYKSGSNIAKFTGDRLKDTSRGFGRAEIQIQRQAKMKRNRVGIRRSIHTQGSFARPDGGDTSLSQSIARADWSGERNVMNTEFFGQQSQRDLMGNQTEKKWDIDILGSNKTEMNLVGNNKKRNNFF